MKLFVNAFVLTYDEIWFALNVQDVQNGRDRLSAAANWHRSTYFNKDSAEFSAEFSAERSWAYS